MMNFRTTLATILLTVCGTLITQADNIRQGAQVTAAENLVSGKPYLLYYVGNNGCYVKAIDGNNYFKALAGDNVITDEAVYYFFIQDGNKWKIQSRKTGKYFPVPTRSTTFAPAEAASAGSWSMNFQTGGNIAPSFVNGEESFSLNRSRLSNGTSVLHGWTEGTAQANQLKIYELALSTTSIVETGQDVSVSGSGETTLTTGQWYVLKLKNDNDFFIDDASISFTTTTAPKGFGIHNSQYLVRLVDAGNGTYNVQTGYGNYLFGSDANIPTAVSATAYTVADLLAKWEFHKLVDPLHPTATEVYTLNGTGAWIFVPNGFGNQYYLYNISQQKFAYPKSSGEWEYSEEAVPVLLESQGDSHYCITTKDGTKTFVIGTEDHMTIAKSRDVTAAETTQLNDALNKLLCYGTSKLTAANQITDGWYALRIHSESNHPDYAGNFLYTLDTENWAYGRPHPMSHGGEYMKHPLKDDATYYVRLWPEGNYYRWQVSNGKYVVNHNNDYPITWIRPASDFVIDTNSDGTFYIQSSGYRVLICTDNQGADYLGKTSQRYKDSPTHLDIYPVDVTAAGLTPWKVVFNTGADDVKLTCTRNDVHGLTAVYNNGFFFLPTGETPGENEFKIGNEAVTAIIHTDDNTIHVIYAPNVCFEAKDVTVIQGSRTTGVGNTKQAILRVEVNPIAPCHPTSFVVNLTGAANVSNIQAWLTTADQLYAEGVTSTLLGTTSNPTEGSNTIIVDGANTSLLMTGEHNYIWITADIKNDANVEANEIDAALTSIGYNNALTACAPVSITDGNPDGMMRIFMRQKYLWVSTDQNAEVSRFYRNPAILSLGDGKVLAFSEYRYDDVSELGNDYDDSGYGHRIDIVMRKSTDNGATWGAPVTIANGTDATETTKASGYSKPAVVRTSNGKIICLMAMGSEAYDSNAGIRHIGMITSSDEGASWSGITDIYNSIDWGEHSPSSAYITPGKGVTFSNGRVAFILNERRTNTTDEYVIYSDDEGVTWTFVPSASLFANGKDAKLEVMNDNRLLATISRGLDANLENRGYAFTTGNASGDGISTWNAGSNWSSLNSYGRNNDILYYKRGTSGFNTTDVLLHTVYNSVSSKEALRLYASFDQAETWKEFFTILPASAGASAMQKFSDGGSNFSSEDGNLVIAFEDGSIGGGANGSYALNYVVIRGDIFDLQVSDLMSSYIIKEGETNTWAPFVDWATGGWTKSFTTTATTGHAGVVVSSTNDYAFNREGNGTQRVLDIKPSATGVTDQITITAPNGFIIKSYTLTGYNKDAETYTITAGEQSVVLNGGKSEPSTLTVRNVDAQSTTFSFASTSGSGSYAQIINFKVELAKGYYTVQLNKANPNTSGEKSYATLYTDFDLTPEDNNTKAYYITRSGIETDKVKLTEIIGNIIPKRTAVILVNSVGAAQTSFYVTDGIDPVVSEEANLLKGTLIDMTIDLSDNSPLYSLGRRKEANSTSYVTGFYHTGESNYLLRANRAYLDLSTPSLARGFDISFGDEEFTEIVDMKRDRSIEPSAEMWYNLDGRKLSGKPTKKGLYVQNGRKVVIK